MPFILLLIGLALIFIEFYVPGGLIGAIGGVLVFAAVIVFGMESKSLLPALLFLFISLLLVGLTIKAALYAIPKQRSIYLQSDQTGYVASSFDKTAIGKTGKVSSDLKPGGHIIVEGKMHQALSVSGYIPKGESVEVIRGEGESLVVKQIKKE